MTFCAARKSPKSRLREGGFRFPPSLKNLIPLKRPRPGASAPALDPAPRGAGRRPGARPLSHGYAVPAPPQGEPRVQCAPGERQRKEKGGAFWFAPDFCYTCHLAEVHLIEARHGLGLHQSLFFSYTVHGAPLLLRTEKKRRGVHDGQDSKSMPCWRKR